MEEGIEKNWQFPHGFSSPDGCSLYNTFLWREGSKNGFWFGLCGGLPKAKNWRRKIFCSSFYQPAGETLIKAQTSSFGWTPIYWTLLIGVGLVKVKKFRVHRSATCLKLAQLSRESQTIFWNKPLQSQFSPSAIRNMINRRRTFVQYMSHISTLVI